jgi:hypothetical protein
MKNRLSGPRAILAAFAVIAVMLGLSAGVASASVQQPANTATHSALSTRASAQAPSEISITMGAASHQGFVTATAPSMAAGGGCHSYGWQFWKDWCGWTFTHAQTVAIYKGSKAVALAVCSKVLHHLGTVAVGMCAAAIEWVEIHHHTEPGKDQCLAIEFHIYGAVTVNYVKC